MQKRAEPLAVYEQAEGNESTTERALIQTAGKCISKPGLSCLLVQIPGDDGRLMRYALKWTGWHARALGLMHGLPFQ